jgi:hypothetical protein
MESIQRRVAVAFQRRQQPGWHAHFLEDLVRQILFGSAMVPSTLLRNGAGNGSIDTEVLGAYPKIYIVAASTGSDFDQSNERLSHDATVTGAVDQ